MAGVSFEKLDEGVRAVNACNALAEVPQTVADVFAGDYALWRVSMVVVDGERAREVATWLLGETKIGVGTEFPVTLTPDMAALRDIAVRGRPVRFVIPETDLGLLGDLLQAEGGASYLGMPLLDEAGALRAAIALISSQGDGFTDDDLPLFEGIARGVERRIVDLIEAEFGPALPA